MGARVSLDRNSVFGLQAIDPVRSNEAIWPLLGHFEIVRLLRI